MSHPEEAGLFRRWRSLLPGAPALGRRLLAAYAEPGRHYHDQVHLREVLDRVDELQAHADDADTVRLAAWFHDAVYDSTRPDNEESSARLAERTLRVAAPGRATTVARLVGLTRTHDPEPADADGAVLCDADLAILAAGPARYRAYAAAVRSEYAHVDDAAFRRGRAVVLQELLRRDQLFRTPYARERWEEPARRNLADELDRLHN